MARTVGFIGVGSMGNPMARNLMAAGHQLVVRDRNDGKMAPLAALGARAAKSARDVADEAEVIFTCLPHNDACREVMLGDKGIAGGTAVKLVVNLGTTGSAFSREMSGALGAQSIAMLDAPISGGAEGARKATLAIMVSGPLDAFKRVEAALKTMGKNVTFIGEAPGAAQTMKLANNLLSATAYAITSEAFVMGAKAGLNPETMVSVINAGSGRNSATEDKFPRAVLNRQFDLGATFNIICKDLALCVAEAESLGTPMSVGSAVQQLFKAGSTQFGGDRDLTTLVQHIEQQAGVEIPKVR